MKNRNQYIQIRVNHLEKETIQKAANQFNLSVSDYIRACIHDSPLKPVPSEISREHISRMATLGNQLNEILTLIEFNHLEPTKAILDLNLQIVNLLVQEDNRHDR